MSITVKTPPDFDVLPTALLADAKQHMRVDWSQDDEFIKSVIARAISNLEDRWGVAINVATYEWKPSSMEFFCGERASVPITPVSSFTAKVGATDVSSSYTITTNTVFGVPLLYLNGPYQSGLLIELAAGFATLPPSVLDKVLRNAAHLFEHREILLPGVEYVAPDVALDATWWVPRV